MSFSMMFRTRLNILPIVPSPLTMQCRFSMSDLFIVWVNKAVATNTNAKNTAPMINRNRLEKPNSKIRTQVKAAAMADDSRIFADEPPVYSQCVMFSYPIKRYDSGGNPSYE